jgi:hypothetical protein
VKRRQCLTVALVLGCVCAARAEQAYRSTAKPPPSACRPSALRDFCRVGCPDSSAALTETRHVEPALDGLRRPLPSGVAILELGIDLQGVVVSACVAKGVRDDFDAAAQAAALQGRWHVAMPLTGSERGFAIDVTVCTPDRAADCKRHLPVTIEVTQDVQVVPSAHVSHESRGTLYSWSRDLATPFWIRRGERFEMVRIYSEGECRVRFRNQEYDLTSCHWLDGFTDHEADIYRVVASPHTP